MQHLNLQPSFTPPTPVCPYRGLRVRMGCHAGVPEECISTNASAQRLQYNGYGLELAKKVGDLAHGAMLTITSQVYDHLKLDALSSQMRLVHCGLHDVGAKDGPIPVYLLYPRVLGQRLPLLGPLRSTPVGDGVLEAPTGQVHLAHVHVVGVTELLHWQPAVTREALDKVHGLWRELLHLHSGYCVECADDTMMAAFHQPQQAVLWALDVHDQALLLEW